MAKGTSEPGSKRSRFLPPTVETKSHSVEFSFVQHARKDGTRCGALDDPGSPLPPWNIRTWEASAEDDLVGDAASGKATILNGDMNPSNELVQDKLVVEAKDEEEDDLVFSSEDEDEDYSSDDDNTKPFSPESQDKDGIESPETNKKIQRLERRLHLLERQNQLLLMDNEKRSATLSPAVYTVHAPKQVRKMRLGRTASISTRTELTRLFHDGSANKQQTKEEISLLERMNNLITDTSICGQHYLASHEFADHLIELCDMVGQVFEKEERILSIDSPMYIFGDLHGNFEDLQFFAEHVWPMGMRLTAGKFLFLGDYVDRGSMGLELLAFLFAQKIQLENKIFMIRGNHETRSVNGWEAFYGPLSFLAQCKNRFGLVKGIEVWEKCNQAFDRMPLAAIVDDSIFCVHGGIPRPIKNANTDIDTRLEAIKNISCPIQIHPPAPEDTDDENALAFSLLWADPADANQETILLHTSETGFGESARGGGTVVFGSRAVDEFLSNNNLDYILRAHEATANGVAVCKGAKVLTVFSTSKDHGCGGEARCGCFLVDQNKIQAITRSGSYQGRMGVSSLPAAFY